MIQLTIKIANRHTSNTLNPIQGHSRKVRRKITLQQLAEVIIAADFSQCIEAVELIAMVWIKHLKLSVPFEWSSSTMN
jgi:hypothetical protein